MTLGAWLAFAATATALLLVPNPLASLTAAFSASWGRKSAFLTVPASILSITLTGLIATTLVLSGSSYWPALGHTLSWIALSYLMLHLLYAFQDPRLRYGLADNDNLPETRVLPVFGHFILTCFKSVRYFMLTAAIAVQFLDPAAAPQQQYIGMLAGLAAAAAISSLAYAFFPNRFGRKHRKPATSGKPLHRPGTRFIARRAVSAGYRRIAA